MIEKLLLIINEMLEESGNNRIEQLESSTRLRDDLKLDSLMLAEFTVRIEDEFSVDVFENGVIYTIGEVMSAIERG